MAEGLWKYCKSDVRGRDYEWRFYHTPDDFSFRGIEWNENINVCYHRKLKDAPAELLERIKNKLLSWINDCPQSSRISNIHLVVDLQDGELDILCELMSVVDGDIVEIVI